MTDVGSNRFGDSRPVATVFGSPNKDVVYTLLTSTFVTVAPLVFLVIETWGDGETAGLLALFGAVYLGPAWLLCVLATWIIGRPLLGLIVRWSVLRALSDKVRWSIGMAGCGLICAVVPLALYGWVSFADDKAAVGIAAVGWVAGTWVVSSLMAGHLILWSASRSRMITR